jgi:enoyl-CoA hydratase/carnithine racemase
MVDVESEGGVTRIFLNRPEKVNALNSAHLEALLLALQRLEGNQEMRVVVLGGRGKAFCGGADVQELAALNASNAGAFVQRIHEVCAAIRKLPLPVVARLHGAVIGAGLEIAAACDLRVAAEGTRFAMPEVRLGIPSVVEAALLPRLMGSGRAAWLVLTGEAIDARRAHEWGLIEQSAATTRSIRSSRFFSGTMQERSICKSSCCSSGKRRRSRRRSKKAWRCSPVPRNGSPELAP